MNLAARARLSLLAGQGFVIEICGPIQPTLIKDNYQHTIVTTRHINPAASVVISTTQRLYATLRGEELDEEIDEISANELAPDPEIPIETFEPAVRAGAPGLPEENSCEYCLSALMRTPHPCAHDQL